LTDCYRRYGETTRLRIVTPTFLVNNPDDIHHVLVAHEENYRKSWRVTGRAGRRMFAFGLLTRRGAAHRRQRRLVQPAFHRHAIVVFAEAIHAHVEQMLHAWANNPIVDVTSEMDRLAEQVLIRALVGDLDESTRQRLSESNRARRRFINYAFRIQFPFPQLLPTRRNWEYQQAVRSQRKMIRELVSRARSSPSGPVSLLAQMAAAESAPGERLSEDELFDEVWELLTAGYETTRDELTWSAYLLAKHPEAAARLRAEAVQVAGERALQAEDVPRLGYAEMFFSEALRLFPPVWMYVRVAIGGEVLPSGVRVPAGSKIYLCQYTAHRNEKFFPDPERFDPDRFLPEARFTRPRFSYFPFGGGERVCVAESLARLEGVLVLAALARRFDLELCPSQVIEPVGAVTLRPRNPIRVTARPATSLGSRTAGAAPEPAP
jgi:cytochrome P450